MHFYAKFSEATSVFEM